MAEAVVSMALETLRDLLLEEAKFLSGVGGEVKALETQLEEIKCLLKDADRRQHGSETITNWIAEIRDLAYKSEDAIESYAIKISSKRGRGFKKLLRRFSCLMNESFSLHQTGSEISKIKSEITRVKQSMQEFGIKSIIQGESSTANTNDNQRWKRQTSPVESEDCFVGKDDDLKQLVSHIVDDKQQRVISIWGTGGIGKTTIAKKVYNHTNIKRSFECFAWVCITQQCRIRSVLDDILKQLIPQERDGISTLTDVELLQKLGQIQQAKRSMIVLDDLWEIEHWDGLKNAFLVQGSSSKVLMTTRIQKVADMGYAFKLGGLSPDDGWKLLKIKAFPYNDIPDNFGMDEKQLEKIGKEMVRKCGYLPLIISVLGGLLSEKRSIEEWVSVNENMNEYLYRGENENEIHGVLRLSYEDLPFYLKPCFLLMGQFMEDEKIICSDLYRMWTAQGMISHEHRRKDQTLIDVAKAYFSELVSRCLVQTSSWDRRFNGEYEICQLHDAVRELCLLEGKKKGFNFRIMNYRGGEFSRLLNESLSSNKSRYLTIHFEGQMTSNLDRMRVHREDTRHIRSLQFLNKIGGERIEFQHSTLELEKFERLRALVFENFRFKGRHWKGIGNVIHLRLLALRNCELDELPSSIRNFKYLQTLDLTFCWNVKVPNVLKEMHRLKQLGLPFYKKEWVERNKYHLTLEGLVELESLNFFNSLVHDLKSIMTMKNLLEISTSMDDNESLSVVIHAITTNLKILRSFRLIINAGCQLESTGEGLVILKSVFSCQTLHELLILVPIKKLQLEECIIEISTSRLHALYLLNCKIEDDPMQILGKFPFLQNLYLGRRAFMGEEMKCHACGFPRLREIGVDSLPNLREWTVEQGAMPLLSSIEIENCPRLEKIPDGFRFTQNLQQLKIIGMPELGKRVNAEEGEDFDKVRHVPSIILR